MLEPAAVLRVVCPLLNIVIELRRPPQRLPVAARAVIFDQRVDDKGFAVKNFAIIADLAGQIGGPEVAAVLAIKEVIRQKAVALFGGFEVIPIPVSEAFEMNAGKGPDHPALRDDLFFRGGAPALNVIGEHKSPVGLVLGGVVPVWQYLFGQV